MPRRPTVEEANAAAPAFAKIFKEMIIVADPTKPFPRSPKGTIIRKQAIALYSAEIEKLYVSFDLYNATSADVTERYGTVAESTDAKGIAPPQTWRKEDLSAWLIKHAGSVNNERVPEPTASLFEQGFDRYEFA